jgi:hypothetical protein
MTEFQFDPYDRLRESCRNFRQYPCTLLDETTPRAVLEGYQKHLVQNDDALFDSSSQRLVFWEAWPGTGGTSPPMAAARLRCINC